MDKSEWTQIIIDGIAAKHSQTKVAYLYAMGIDVGITETGQANRAIIRRWSTAGLVRIKTMAWDIIEAGQWLVERQASSG